MRDEREKKRKTIKKHRRHIKTSITAPLVLLKKSRRDESNDTKKSHQRWPKRATLAAKDKWATHHLWATSMAHLGHRVW
jgi:hypothetical protein